MPSSTWLVSFHPPHSSVNVMSFNISQISWWFYFSKNAHRFLKMYVKVRNKIKQPNITCVVLTVSCYIFNFPNWFFFLVQLEFRSVRKQWALRIPSSWAKHSSTVENNKDVFIWCQNPGRWWWLWRKDHYSWV